MPRSCVEVYLHLVWGTWDRLPLITGAVEEPLYACLTHECREMRCVMLGLGGIEDHVHVLVRIPSTLSVADLVKQLKGASSHFVNHRLTEPTNFRWQGTYGAFSVSPHDLDRVKGYLSRQREHHATGDLWPEWERLAELGEP